MAKTRVKADPTVVQMQLKVTLLSLRPGIWRRLVVPAKIKLPKLHDALQCAFDWTDSHMHAFRLGAETYQELAPRNRSWVHSIAGSSMTSVSSGSATCCTPQRTG